MVCEVCKITPETTCENLVGTFGEKDLEEGYG